MWCVGPLCVCVHQGSEKGASAEGGEDPELAAIKARMREMEEEAEKLKQLQTEVDKQLSLASPGISKHIL